MLPIPTPATVLLLEGFEFVDDGLEGERVTPTGARSSASAMLRRLRDRAAAPAAAHRHRLRHQDFPGHQQRAARAGVRGSARWRSGGDEVAQIQFEVDDQTPEDLAIALDKLRAHPSVLDVLQTPAFGKKGRMTMRIQMLAESRTWKAYSMPASAKPRPSACVTRSCSGASWRAPVRRWRRRAGRCGSKSPSVPAARPPRSKRTTCSTSSAGAPDANTCKREAEQVVLKKERK